MVRDSTPKRGSKNDASETQGKRRRSFAGVARKSKVPSQTDRGRPGTGRPDEEEDYQGSKQGPK